VVASGLVSFPFPLEVPFLPTIIDVRSFFTRMRLGAEDGGGGDALGEAGALKDYFPHKEEVGSNLDPILGVAAALRQRKTKGQGSKSASEGVSKTLSYRAVK
jgi:hypothetical protein